jgi:hypothetical protein
VDYTFFSAAHGTFSEIDHSLRHKRVLTNRRKLEIILVLYKTTMEYDQKSIARETRESIQIHGD